MSINPLASVGGGGVLGAAGAGLSMLDSFQKLFGPKGALVTGDIGQGMSAANTMYSGGQSLFGGGTPTPALDSGPTTQSAMGISPEQFKQIASPTGERLLRQATEGGGFSGNDVRAFGISPEEFNRIPPEVRQELLRKLAKR